MPNPIRPADWSRLALLFAIGALAGCAAPWPGTGLAPGLASEVTLPLVTAWHEGSLVQYISTDTSDAGMARAKNMNFVPRLAQALEAAPAGPGKRTVLERVYIFPDASQFNVFPSAPQPVGPASTDPVYSPLWHLYAVTWQAGRTRRELRSEDQVLDAAERGDVSITPTRIVTNCPVVYSVKGGLLPGARLGPRRP